MNSVDIWTVTYKDDSGVYSVSFTSEDKAKECEQMTLGSHGGELFDGGENPVGFINIEWCHLVKTKLWVS